MTNKKAFCPFCSKEYTPKGNGLRVFTVTIENNHDCSDWKKYVKATKRYLNKLIVT